CARGAYYSNYVGFAYW
nr:immunoglobulin heavy chain junction region [Mus musculus]